MLDIVSPVSTPYDRSMYDLCFATTAYDCAAYHASHAGKAWEYKMKLLFNVQVNECTRMYMNHVKYNKPLNLVPFYKLLLLMGGETAVHRACRLRETLFQYQIDYVDFFNISGGDGIHAVVIGNKPIHELVIYFSCCPRVNVDAKYMKHLDQMPVDDVYNQIRNGFNEIVNLITSVVV